MEGVNWGEGRVLGYCYGAVAAGEKEVCRWSGVVEGYLICLEGLLVGGAGGGGW